MQNYPACKELEWLILEAKNKHSRSGVFLSFRLDHFSEQRQNFFDRVAFSDKVSICFVENKKDINTCF